MAVTRSFGRPVTALAELREAVTAYAARAGEKQRAHGLVAGQLAAIFHTSPHRGGSHHYGQRSARLVPMTSDACRSFAAASRCVEAAWRGGRGCKYVKSGALLDDLCPPDAAPHTPFAAPSPRADRLTAAMGGLNANFGRNTIFPVAIASNAAGSCAPRTIRPAAPPARTSCNACGPDEEIRTARSMQHPRHARGDCADRRACFGTAVAELPRVLAWRRFW